jgi:F-type H+-transporting ATPase subunit epsilon
MKMKIISPTGTHFNGEVLNASFPGVIGEFAVLNRHAPLVSALKKGTVKYTIADNSAHTFTIGGGFVEVRDNVVSVCVEEQKL